MRYQDRELAESLHNQGGVKTVALGTIKDMPPRPLSPDRIGPVGVVTNSGQKNLRHGPPMDELTRDRCPEAVIR